MSTRMFVYLAFAMTGMIGIAVAAGDRLRSVKAVPWEFVAINPEVSAPATVLSLSDSRIGAELNARIAEIPVRVGDVVAPGGLLARLDCEDYELAVAELEARLTGIEARIVFAREQLRRAQSLKRQQTVSQELLEQRESSLASLVAEYKTDQARLGMAQRNVSKCALRAPFQAAVVERLASVGEYATPGSPVLRVLDIARLEVSANMTVGDAETLPRATEVVFRHGNTDYPVELRAVTLVIDSLTRTREARLLFQEAAALPGATGRLVWRVGPALPADLLVRRDRQLGVLIADRGKVRFHPIPGAREGRPAGVILPPGTMIITEGRFALNDGDAIEMLD